MKYEKVLKVLASLSNHHQYRLACIIVKNGNVVGVGYNMLKTSPKSLHAFKSVHAEFRAVRDAGENTAGSIAYIFRQTRDGKLATARPCKSCMRHLKHSRVKKVVYTFEGDYKKERI